MCKVTIDTQSCGCEEFHELRVAFGNMKNCQLKCIFCFTSEQKPSTSDLSDLGRMNMEGINLIRFTGGEPLLSQTQVDGMIREISIIEKKNISSLNLIVIQTNALSVEKLNLDGFLKLSYPILFEVSFKGTNPQEYSNLVFYSKISIKRAKEILIQQARGLSFSGNIQEQKECCDSCKVRNISQ
jgi:molybdenum cofactor biosynthesis enzyme MoaA